MLQLELETFSSFSFIVPPFPSRVTVPEDRGDGAGWDGTSSEWVLHLEPTVQRPLREPVFRHQSEQPSTLQQLPVKHLGRPLVTESPGVTRCVGTGTVYGVGPRVLREWNRTEQP